MKRSTAFLLGLFYVPALYLWMIKPNRPRLERMKVFEKQYIAHRGLHDNEGGIPENSLPAFRRAVEAGYGIEFDVQMTRDGKLVVFHDATLKRMCGVDEMPTKLTYAELQKYVLLDTQEHIPLFEEVLQIVDGKVPMIIEMKSEGKCIKATAKMCKRMESYHGVYCMESFHPFCVNYVRRHYPDMIRGQLSMDFFLEEPDKPFYQKLVMTSLVANSLARPDFIAYKHDHKEQFSYKLCRKMYHVENVAWTIKSQKQLEAAKDTFRVMIFDSFIPKKS